MKRPKPPEKPEKPKPRIKPAAHPAPEQEIQLDAERWSGFRDSFGEREVGIDADGSPIELLRLIKEFAPFESAMAERIAKLGAADRPGAARPLRLDQDDQKRRQRLVLVSERVAGVRLSEALTRGASRSVVPDIGAAMYVMRRLFSIAAAMKAASGVSHFILAPERVVVTPRAEIVVVEAALAGGTEALSAAQAFPKALKLAFSEVNSKKHGYRLDIARIARIGVAMLIGRGIDTTETVDALSAVLNEVSDVAAIRAGDAFATSMRTWLDHALTIEAGVSFADFHAAGEALKATNPPKDCAASRGTLRTYLEGLQIDDLSQPDTLALEADRVRAIRARQTAGRTGPHGWLNTVAQELGLPHQDEVLQESPSEIAAKPLGASAGDHVAAEAGEIDMTGALEQIAEPGVVDVPGVAAGPAEEPAVFDLGSASASLESDAKAWQAPPPAIETASEPLKDSVISAVASRFGFLLRDQPAKKPKHTPAPAETPPPSPPQAAPLVIEHTSMVEPPLVLQQSLPAAEIPTAWPPPPRATLPPIVVEPALAEPRGRTEPLEGTELRDSAEPREGTEPSEIAEPDGSKRAKKSWFRSVAKQFGIGEAAPPAEPGLTEPAADASALAAADLLAVRIAEEEAQRVAEEVRHLAAAEAESRRVAEQARRQAAEAEGRRVAEEARRLAAETEARRVAEAEARRLAQEAEARRFAEAEARRVAETEARRLAAEAEARRVAEAEARRLAAQAEARRIAEADARRLAAEAEARRIAEAEARRLAAEAEARRTAEAEARRLAAEAEARRLAADADARRLAAEAQARRAAEEEAARRAAEKAGAGVEEEVDEEPEEAASRESWIKSVAAEMGLKPDAEAAAHTPMPTPSWQAATPALGTPRPSEWKAAAPPPANLPAPAYQPPQAPTPSASWQAATPAYGTPTPSAYGTPAPSAYGTPTPAYGTPVPSAYGTPTPAHAPPPPPAQAPAPAWRPPPSSAPVGDRTAEAAVAKPAPKTRTPTRVPEIIAAASQLMRSAALLIVAAGVVGALGWFGYSYYSNTARPGTIAIESNPPGADIFIDGVSKGVTPLTIELPPGKHDLELRRRGASRQISFDIAAGEQLRQEIDLTNLRAVGTLVVNSTPKGAKVVVDGKERGVTPLTLADLAVGAHKVLIESTAGSVTKDVQIQAGATVNVDEGIFSGWIAVFAPFELQVYDGKRLIGSTETERIMVPPGHHEFELVNTQRGFRETRSVDIGPGATVPINVEQTEGTVRIDAPAGSEIFIDGAKVGEAPIGDQTVTIGTREILVRHPQLGEKKVTATVTSSAPADVKIEFNP